MAINPIDFALALRTVVREAPNGVEFFGVALRDFVLAEETAWTWSPRDPEDPDLEDCIATNASPAFAGWELCGVFQGCHVATQWELRIHGVLLAQTWDPKEGSWAVGRYLNSEEDANLAPLT